MLHRTSRLWCRDVACNVSHSSLHSFFRLPFERAIFRILIIAQSEKYRGTQLQAALGSFIRPLGKFNYSNPLRFPPVLVLGVDRPCKRTLLGFNFLKSLEDLLQHGLVEASSSMADVD